nr:TauD/TfdA family dioxygenase [Burkholderiaceae bacterium]
MPTPSWTLETAPGASFGARVTGLDLNQSQPDFFERFPALLAHHGVLVFPGQSLSPEAVQAVAERLGSVEESVMDQFAKPGHPKIYTLSNIVENGRPIGSATDGYGWHTDQGYFAHPTAYTLLYGIETPAEGADTLFSDTRRAWDSLPPERQERLL